MTIELKNFGGKIRAVLKDKVDEHLKITSLPMGRVVEALAEFFIRLTPEEQKHLCYGTGDFDFGKYIDARISNFFSSPEGMMLAKKLKLAPKEQPIKEQVIEMAQNIGHYVTYKIPDTETRQQLEALRRLLESNLRPAKRA